MSRVLHVGTTKGLFSFQYPSSSKPKIAFEGQSVFSIGVVGERVWVSPHSEWMGPSVGFSDDLGNKWNVLDKPLKFPKDSSATVSKIWQIAGFGDDLYFGVEPAALFKYKIDEGAFELCEGLWNHPHRSKWQPGFGGLCLHTIIFISDLVWIVGVSTGGAYRTEDGGKTWAANNQAIETPFLPGEEIPDFGQCVHKIAVDPGSPNVLFLQHHWGVYKSVDTGLTWQNISRDKNLPSDFGFACVSNVANTAFIIPIQSDNFRCFPDGKMKIFRTKNSGGDWEELSDGLPQKNAYDCVLRDSFSSKDDFLAVGTTGGSLFVSDNNGEKWNNISNNLPRITCLRIQ